MQGIMSALSMRLRPLWKILPIFFKNIAFFVFHQGDERHQSRQGFVQALKTV